MKQAVLGILLSGRGSNFCAIADAIENGSLKHATIGLVIANRPEAAGIGHARERGLKTLITKDQDEMIGALQKAQVDVVILAGFDRILSPAFTGTFNRRILNIHPSLLPKFGGRGMVGLRVHEAVIAAGETLSGCTVHLVTDDVDEGPILGQAKVPVLPQDTPDTLAAKVLREEHQLFAGVIESFINEHILNREAVQPYGTTH